MAESDISDLISELQDIAAILRPLIKKQIAIGGRIDEKIREVREHHTDCNIARSFGAGASTAGGSLMAASDTFQERDRSTASDIGLAVTAVGKFISFVTDIADEARSKTFVREVKEIVSLQNDLSVKMRKKLAEFESFLTRSSRSRKLLKDIGFHPEERFSQHQSQLFATDSNRCGDMTADIDFSYIVNTLAKKVGEVQRAADIGANLGANRYNGRPQLRGITAGSHPMTLSTNRVTSSSALLPTIASTLHEIGAVDDIGAAIKGWTNKHQIEVAMIEFRKRLKESIATLLDLSKDIEESVPLLEKKLMQMRSRKWSLLRATGTKNLQQWSPAVTLSEAYSAIVYYVWIFWALLVTAIQKEPSKKP